MLGESRVSEVNELSSLLSSPTPSHKERDTGWELKDLQAAGQRTESSLLPPKLPFSIQMSIRFP